MRATSKLLALALAAVLQPAFADVGPVTFEDVKGFGQLTDQYKNSLGITFAGDAWGIESKYGGCTGQAQFLRAGSCGGLELALDAIGGVDPDPRSFTLDLAGGFITKFSFFYSALADANVQIELFEGEGGTGKVLQTFSGLTEANCTEANVRFCIWNSASFEFEGTALSLKVTGADQRLMLDDLQFITPGTPNPLPEPASIALALSALGALGWTRKRAAR